MQTLQDVDYTAVTCAIHGTPVTIGLYEQVWDDGSYIFFGYHDENTPDVTIAGQKVRLRIEIIPEGAPERINPFLPYVEPGQTTVTWYENATDTLSAAFAFLQDFEENRPYLVDGSLNSKLEKFYNHQDFIGLLNIFLTIVEDERLSASKKAEQKILVFLSLLQILENTQIPDEFKYEESDFFLGVLKLEEHVKELIEEAGSNPQNFTTDFYEVAQHLVRTLNTIHNDHRNVARRLVELPSEAERTAILHVLEELAQIQTLDKNSVEALLKIERELQLCQLVWETPFIDWQTRLDCATRAVNILSDAIDRAGTAAIESRKRHANIPDLSRFVSEINNQLAKFDKTGFATMADLVADRFYDNANDGAEVKLPLTGKELADSVVLHTLLVSIAEKAGKISTSFHLSLSGGETNDTRQMYVQIDDGIIREIKLPGL